MRVEDTAHFGQLFPTQTCILCLPQPPLLCDLEVVTPLTGLSFPICGVKRLLMLSPSQTYLGASLRQAFLMFACSHIFKNYFRAMSQPPYCATISSAIHSSQSCLQAPITVH